MQERLDLLLKRDTILSLIDSKKSKYEIAIYLGCNHKTLNKYLDIMQINYKGRQNWSKGKVLANKHVTFEEYVKRGGKKTSTLKRKLLQDNIKPYQCENCKLTEWLGQPIPLELHHKNGNHNDVRISNLILLCPNCHALTDTYRGRKAPTIYFCKSCGKSVSGPNKMCKSCAGKLKVRGISKKVDKETLKNDLIELQNFSAIGKKYGVSDNAIRKWCKSYELPTHSKELKTMYP